MYNFVFQFIHWRINAKIFAVIWIVIGALCAYFVTDLGVIINSEQIQNAVQTNVNESADLLTTQLIIWCFFFIVIPLIIVFNIPIKKESIKKNLIAKLISAVLSLIVMFSSLYLFYVDYAAIFREHRELKGMISPQNIVASSLSYYKKQQPRKNLPLVSYGTDAKITETQTNQNLPKLMVVVVGETARAESFSLNGYTRPTNPELSKLDIINYQNVSSCGTATAVSLPCMFSGMPRKEYDEGLASHRENLLDIAQRAGYKVTWIDNNSGCKEVCNRVEQYVIPEKIKQKWCDSKDECKDDLLIDALNEYLATKKDEIEPRLIVLHQMGSHGPAYYKRTRPEYAPFKPICNTNAIQGCSQQDLINTYDNSIVYTDYILSSIIKNLDKVKSYQTAFWYLSDHGESTGESGLYLHGSPYAIAPKQQTRIPMIMWFSNDWKKMNGSIVSCLASNKNKEYSQDNFFPSLLKLLDIQSETMNSELIMTQQCNN